jgi:hypothetical protein
VTCHEEVDEVADLGALGLRQPGQMGVRRPAEPESSELLGEPRALDPPERLEELDERDPGRVRCLEEIVKGSTIRITPPSDTRGSGPRARPFVRRALGESPGRAVFG